MSKKVHVQISSRTAVLLEPYPIKKLLPHWSFSHPKWNYIRSNYAYWDDKEGKWAYRWDGRIKLFKYGKLPAGLFWATYRDIEKEEHIRFKIHKSHHNRIHRTSHRHWIKSEKIDKADYRYQNECVDKIIEKMYKGGGLVLSATGSGKTRMAAMFASRVKCELLFIVDQIVLLDQAQHDIRKHLHENVGKVGEQKFQLGRVTVATIQTLALHLHDYKFRKWFQNVDVIFIDELHEMMNKSNFKLIEIAKPKLVIGLTATLKLTQKPVRMKAYSLCGPVIYEFPLKLGQEMGVLSRGIAIELKYDNSIRDTGAYLDSKQAYDKRIVENSERNKLISRIVKRGTKLGKYIFVLVDRLKHLEEISDRLHGIPRKVVAGSFKGRGIDKVSRIQSKLQFEAGEIKTIIASKVFKKGVDVKRLDLIIDAAGRKSSNDTIQKFGRGTRIHKHKTGLIYIDISDYDKYDKHRDKDDKKNWLATASRKRKRSLRSIGVPVHTFTVQGASDTQEIKSMFRKAQKWLEKETRKR